MRKAEVQMFGQTAGYLTEDDNGEYTFAYTATYLSQTISSTGTLTEI